MTKFFGVLFYLLSFLLISWSLLSALGLLMNFSVPEDAYSIGLLTGKVLAITLFSLLGIRAFKAGKRRFTTASDEKTAI
ncbi:hypothetical protein [Alteromonas gracilis]|uniref:hypothetical protein n=1 Tax=Alteromonas gracilis TaxID=1479524 RepID=UPI003736D271